MSVFRSLFTASSGITAHGNAISIVGDNIANVSTTGFRASRAAFSDVLGSRLGQNRVGAGATVRGVQTLHQQGALRQTGGPLDMAVLGGGFFVVGEPGTDTGNLYTRDGSFAMDTEGNIRNSQGLALKGYSIDINGEQSTQLETIQLGAGQSPPRATSVAELVLNLDSSAAPPAAWDVAQPDATSNFATSMTVYDSLGAAHRVDLYFRSNSGGSWEWHALADGGEIAGGTPGVATEIGDGTLTFSTDGALDTETQNNSSVDFTSATPGQALSFDFGDAISTDGGTGLSGTTQFEGVSTVAAVNQNGFSQGILLETRIADDGTIEGVFSNGQSRSLARVALAMFNSEDGLAREGGAMFSETTASGQPLIDAAAEGSRGAIIAGTLESSSVDISNELVTLIAYQRAMQASVRSVTTADEMLAEIANMKR